MGLWQNLKDTFSTSLKEGIPLPVAKDVNRGEASVTLFFMYIFNMCALASLIYLHIQDTALTAALVTATYSIIWTVLYMMRHIQKAKFDLDDKSIDLEGDDEGDPDGNAAPADPNKQD